MKNDILIDYNTNTMEQKSNEKYDNAKIYKITCNITGLCYVGSTCLTLSQRLNQHEYDYKRYLNGKRGYVTSFEILEHDNYQISLLQAFPCENNQELLVREGWFIKKYWDRLVNKRIEGKTIEEKRNDRNHKKKEKLTCECGIQYNYSNKSNHIRSNKHKEYTADQSDSE